MQKEAEKPKEVEEKPNDAERLKETKRENNKEEGSIPEEEPVAKENDETHEGV